MNPIFPLENHRKQELFWVWPKLNLNTIKLCLGNLLASLNLFHHPVKVHLINRSFTWRFVWFLAWKWRKKTATTKPTYHAAFCWIDGTQVHPSQTWIKVWDQCCFKLAQVWTGQAFSNTWGGQFVLFLSTHSLYMYLYDGSIYTQKVQMCAHTLVNLKSWLLSLCAYNTGQQRNECLTAT